MGTGAAKKTNKNIPVRVRTFFWKNCLCRNCWAENDGILYYSRGFILKKIQWHIQAGSWSLVNCWQEALTRHYIRCSWILMNAAVGLMDGLGLDGDRCIRVIPQHPPFSMKEEALPACQELLQEILQWSLRDWVMQQIWMYYKEKLTKNLADLNTFKTSMSLRGLRYKLEMNFNPLSIYICTHCPQVAQRC